MGPAHHACRASRASGGGDRLNETARVGATAPAHVPAHVPALDGVRGLAVLIVIIHNAAWLSGPSEQFVLKLFGAVAASGWIGVQLFFALSGYLITGILLDSRGHPGYFRSFYLRRTLRIFPLYYAFLMVVVFVAAPLAWSPTWAADVRSEQWPYWLYLSNWMQPFGVDIHGLTHLWSLAVEEQFYFLWPVLAWWLGRRGLARFAVALIITAPFIRYGLRAAGLPLETAYMFTIARWDALAAGALLAAMLRDPQGRALIVACKGRVTAAAALALIALVLRQRGFHSEDIPNQVIGQSLIGILSTCLIAYAVLPGTTGLTALQRTLSAGWLRTVGKYSYAMYVFHFPIHHLMNPYKGAWELGSDDPLRIVRVLGYLTLVILLSFAAALVSWRLIEKPFLDLKEKWAPRVG